MSYNPTSYIPKTVRREIVRVEVVIRSNNPARYVHLSCGHAEWATTRHKYKTMTCSTCTEAWMGQVKKFFPPNGSNARV